MGPSTIKKNSKEKNRKANERASARKTREISKTDGSTYKACLDTNGKEGAHAIQFVKEAPKKSLTSESQRNEKW